MSGRSRDEKLASAKKKLKKFQENNTKTKTENIISADLSKNKINQLSQIQSNNVFESPITRNGEENKTVNDSNNQNQFCNVSSLSEPNATSEGFQQISRHLNGIISYSNSSIDRESQTEYINTIRDLEKRNIDLATLNSQKLEQIEILNTKISQLNDNLKRVNRDYTQDKVNMEKSFNRQIESIKDQLQAQVHTISLLVAEKSELQSQITHNQKLSSQRHQEIEDITGKLKNSRQKVGDLEKNLNELKIQNSKLEEARTDMSRQLEQFRNTVKKYKSEKEDLISECSQYKSKLLAKTQEASNLEINLDDVKSQLEMCQVQIQQLTNSQEGQFDDIFKKLKNSEKKNHELLSELNCTKTAMQQVETQNERLQNQYRSYFEQMEERQAKMKSECTLVEKERNTLILEIDRVKIELSEFKNSSIKEVEDKTVVIDLQKEKDNLLKKIRELEDNAKHINEKYNNLISDNEQLTKMNYELEEKNVNLMEVTKQSEINKSDHVLLLEQLQSDKTALSRALSQNKQLKSQLFELQEAFVKLSSDNMELSTNLQHEQHVNKELASRFGEQEDELSEIRFTIQKKEEEIKRLNQSHREITEELIINNSGMSHMKNKDNNLYEVNKDLVKKLQNDLTSSQERINQLTNENNGLKCQIINEKLPLQNKNKFEKTENDESLRLNLTIQQLKAERDELFFKCKQLEKNNVYQQNVNSPLTDQSNKINESSQVNFELNASNQDFNEKLDKLLKENTSLHQYNDQLEHIIAQLEGETDTIGEYISLYQSQRAILKQRNQAKDQFLTKLEHEKKMLSKKLMTFEEVISQLSVLLIEETKKDIKLATPRKADYISLLSQIFDLLNDIKRISKLGNSNSIKDSENISHNSSYSINTQSDDLINYKIIHCKCCTGKIIDL